MVLALDIRNKIIPGANYQKHFGVVKMLCPMGWIIFCAVVFIIHLDLLLHTYWTCLLNCIASQKGMLATNDATTKQVPKHVDYSASPGNINICSRLDICM